MAQTTTNYGLLKPESTDSYNHLIYDNPNMDRIDAAMKANADAAIDTATCIKSGTTHTITRTNTSANVFKFTATGDWNTGDTMVIDGVTVSPYLPTGEALKTGAYIINSEVIIALSGVRATVLSNQSEAGTTYFDDANVTFTANNVASAIEALNSAANIEYVTGVSVKNKLDVLGTISNISVLKNDLYVTSIFLQSCKKVGNMMSLYIVYALGSGVPDDAILFTLSGVTMKGDGCTLTCSNTGSVQGLLATDSQDNTIHMSHQLGSGVSRFHLVLPCE